MKPHSILFVLIYKICFSCIFIESRFT